MDTVTCSKCGTINDSESTFCSECGEKISQIRSTFEEKIIPNNEKVTKYILKRNNLGNVKSTFLTKNDDHLLYRIETSNNLMSFLYMFLILASVYPQIYIMIQVYLLVPFKGLYFLIFEILVIPLIVIVFLLISVIGRTLKLKVFSENNDKKGIIKSNSKLFNLKSTLMGKSWKFTTTDNNIEFYLNFSNRNHGILLNNQVSYNITINQDKKDKRFYRGIIKIEAFNEQDNSFINIEIPENITAKRRRRIPPRILEIYSNNSVNELLVVFFTTIIVAKYFIMRK